jgi:LmbE family N-acetylglucosaminyl deacetylase
MEEAQAAGKALGVADIVFYLLKDGALREEILEKEITQKLYTLIKKEKPTKIFMPAIDDIHNDHRAVARTMLQIHSQHALRTPIYTYTIWNPLAILKRKQPRLVIDVANQHAKKIEAIRCYKSQWVSMYQLVPIVLLKTFIAGTRRGVRWAEVFIRVR